MGERGFELVEAVCNDGKYLEKLTGLDGISASVEALAAELGWDADGSDDDF